MSWFGSSKDTTPPAPQASNDGGYIAPDRTSRQQCWDMRDQFFQCLDAHDILDSVKEDDKAKKVCGAELKGFERDCASSWVTYFKKRRVFEHQKEETIRRLEGEGVQGRENSAGGTAAKALRGSR